MNKGLSIIIINYYSEEYIIEVVKKTLSMIKIENYEIIIVNNSPTIFPWTKEYKKQNNIKIIVSEGNDGFGRSINKGVDFSKYDYFCMLNPDIEIKDNIFDPIYEYFQILDEDVGAVSCIINNKDGSRQSSFFMDRGLEKKSFFVNYFKFLLPGKLRNLFFKEKIINIDFSEAFEVGGFYCSFVMMKKHIFKELKGFDPDFFMYAEDVEFFRSRFVKKYRAILYPYVSLIHLSGKTDKYGLMKEQAQASYLLYLYKCGYYYLGVYIFLLIIKYGLLIGFSFFKQREDTEEAYGFFRSLKYLKIILKYPRKFGSLPQNLKIDKILD